jgi:hypothetical protein
MPTWVPTNNDKDTMNSSKNSSQKRQSFSTANSINIWADDYNAIAGEYLLDCLRILLNRLQLTAEILQN